MNPARSRSALSAALLMLAISVGCGDDSPSATPSDPHAPDVALSDVNPNSVTSGQSVSPQDYLGSVSAQVVAESDCTVTVVRAADAAR